MRRSLGGKKRQEAPRLLPNNLNCLLLLGLWPKTTAEKSLVNHSTLQKVG